MWNFSTNKLKAPCQDCSNREVGCRDKCAAWKQYQELKDAEELKRKIKFYGVSYYNNNF